MRSVDFPGTDIESNAPSKRAPAAAERSAESVSSASGRITRPLDLETCDHSGVIPCYVSEGNFHHGTEDCRQRAYERGLISNRRAKRFHSSAASSILQPIESLASRRIASVCLTSSSHDFEFGRC